MGCLVLCFLAPGCAGLRLPAIDPSGERIFLPPPNYTALDDGTSFSGPAWTSPPQAPLAGTPAASVAVVPYSINTPTPPLYGPFTGAPLPYGGPQASPFYGGPSASNAPTQLSGLTSLDPRDGIQGRLEVQPTRVLAPVGQEVILLAAICGADGYMVTGEPLEWTLAPNSVGTIVEVDHPERGKYVSVGCPIKLSDSPVDVVRSPLLGEHTTEILQDILGYQGDALARVLASGAVGETT